MKLAGSIAIAAPERDVWDLLVDPLAMAACVPGLREVRQVDDRTFEGSISVAVGPMEGDFSFTSVITRAEPPDLEVTVAGRDSLTSSRLDASVTATLAADNPSGTTLRYAADVTVGGRMAILGEMVLRAAATLIIGRVTRCLQARLDVGA